METRRVGGGFDPWTLSGAIRQLLSRRRPPADRAAQPAGEEFHRAMLDDIPQMICRWRPDGRILYVNDTYCRYFAVTREQVLGESALSLFRPSSGDRIDAELYRANPVAVVEFPVTQPDGGVRWQRWIDRALFDAQGELREFQSIGEDVTERKRAEREVQRLLEENRRLARLALESQERERARLARELHDELGQSITAIRADAACIQRLQGDPDSRIGECAGAIDTVAGQMYGAVQQMMQRLHPALLDDLGLAAALRELIEQWRARHPLVAVRHSLETLDALPGEVALAAYRITQEALTNVAKHAHAREVEILLRRFGRAHVELIVRDDGRGLDPALGPQGYGMLGMRERALALGGRFDVTGAHGEGAALRALLPIRQAEADDHGPT